MPDVNVKGRYRIYTHDGTSPLLFTSYSNSLCSIRRPNPNTFITISTYIPGSLSPFTTFDPGSSYTIVSRSNTANFSIGPYVRADRLPSSVTFRSPNFYHGLDKNSITVAISSYASSVGSPLSTVFTYIPDADGYAVNSISFNTERYNQGLPSLLTHLTPGSSYQFLTRTPFTFFAPLQSEMGDAWATGLNVNGQLGMGYQYNSFGYTQLYGNWDKVVMSSTHAAALSTCGTKKKLFVCGGNTYGQLGLTNVDNAQPTLTATQTVWRELKNIWTWDWNNDVYKDILLTENILDAEVGSDFTLIKTNVQMYGCGRMCNMGIAAPGAQGDPGYQFNGVGGDSFTNRYVPYFTSYLNRSTALKFTTIQGSDSTLYNQIPSNNINKFQARDLRWYWLDAAGRLYGAGKMGGTTSGLGGSTSSPGILPIGQSTTSTTANYASIVQLYGPGDYSTRYNNQFFSDFNASPTNIVALSSNYITWVAGGATSGISNSSSLSTICFFDPVQNAYVPQNDYFLRLFPTHYGYMGIVNGKLYFSGSATFYGVNGAGDNVASRLPATTLPRLNGALGANPQESLRFRSLIPLTYMGQPDISWKSLHCGQLITAAIDNNNKLYVCGSNANGYLGAPTNPPTTNLITTLTQIIPDNIYNVNANDLNLVVYKTNRNPATSPTPVPSPTPPPTPTPQLIFKTQGFLTGNWPHSTQASSADGVRDGGTSNSGWSTNILFNEPAGRDNCNSQVYNNYSSILAYDYGANSTNPAQSTRVYRHYSNRTFESAQMEPQSFGGRNCYVFNGYSSGPGNNIIDSSKLCFQYFSQNFPRTGYCSMIDGTNPVGYLQPIYSKMAPNSGTFQDNRNSKQRIEIDSSDIGNSAMTDFYINPVNNSYHVLYHKKVNPSSTSDFQYYFYYTNSYDRGATWSTPILANDGQQTNLSYSRGGPWLDSLFCGRGWPLDHLVILDTQRGSSNTPKPVALYSTTGGSYNAYSLRFSYTINSPFDASVDLVTNTSTSNTVNFHGDIGNLKLLTDQSNSLIAMYCGADTPPTQGRWWAGDGTDGGGSYGTPYTGTAPCRIYYRYCNLNSFQWSEQREIGKTFPRVGGFPYLPSVNPPGRGFLGRIYDACIDTSDNTLCIVYTPTVDRNTSSSAKWSFCAWKLYVKKVNIYTNTTIFDELVYDITSHATTGGFSYVKTITVSNIYYDTQRASLVVCAHTAYDSTIGNGAGVTLQRAGANNWSYIGNGPFGGTPFIARRLKLITQNYV